MNEDLKIAKIKPTRKINYSVYSNFKQLVPAKTKNCQSIKNKISRKNSCHTAGMGS